MDYSEQTIAEIIKSNFNRLEYDESFNKILLLIIVDDEINQIPVTKNHILNEFKESKHTISSMLRFMDGLGFLKIQRKGKENLYKITKCGSKYLEKYLSTDHGRELYSLTGYNKK